jgi:hypothetical protein
MRAMKTTYLIAVLALAACKSSDAKSAADASAVPCDPGATELNKLLDQANGIGVDLTKDAVQKEIADAKAELGGKKYAFKGCYFAMQGGDSVSFKGTETGDDIDCHMAGGEKGNKEFRHAAMDLDTKKMRLDVSGTIGEYDNGAFKRLGMIECKITAHE